MARPAQYATIKTGDFHAVDLVRLRRSGADRPGCSSTYRWTSDGRQTGSIGCTMEDAGLRLKYLHTPKGSTQPILVDELILIVTTPTQFAGTRHWFNCLGCGRRCRIIYGGARFRCRLCYGAKYEFSVPAPGEHDFRHPLGYQAPPQGTWRHGVALGP